MESNGTCVLLRVCECLYSTRNKIFALKKLFVAPPFLQGPCRRPYPPPYWHCGYLQHGRLALGHLGHGFYVASWRQRAACCHCLWVIWVIVFLVTQMTQSVLHKGTRVLILWVIWVILSSNKNRCGKARACAVPNFQGLLLLSLYTVYKLLMLSINNDPNAPKHTNPQHWRALALGSLQRECIT